MPIYDFECEKCSKIIEVTQGFNDDPPKCNCGGHTKKLITGNSSFKLKGEGWFKDLYSKKPPRNTTDEA